MRSFRPSPEYRLCDLNKRLSMRHEVRNRDGLPFKQSFSFPRTVINNGGKALRMNSSKMMLCSVYTYLSRKEHADSVRLFLFCELGLNASRRHQSSSSSSILSDIVRRWCHWRLFSLQTSSWDVSSVDHLLRLRTRIDDHTSRQTDLYQSRNSLSLHRRFHSSLFLD